MSEEKTFPTRKSYQPGLVFQPEVHQNIGAGINKLVAAIRPTLGPTPRTVAVTRLDDPRKPPDVLDNGGIIARKVIEMDRRDEDMGAMLARALICRQHEQMGDGSATAAVLLQAIYRRGVHYLAAGGNAMRLRYFLERALVSALNGLDEMTTPVEGKGKLAQIAGAICHDAPLAKLLGEIFDVIGAYGQLDIRKDNGRSLRREYIEGMYWNSGVFSRDMITNQKELQTVFEEPTIVLADFQINDPRHVMPMLELAVDEKVEKLLLIAGELSDNAIAGLLMANGKLKNFQVIAVRGPGMNPDDRQMAIHDLAVVTGAIPLLKDAGHNLKDIRRENLGAARRAWAGTHSFGIIGGKGNPRHLRRHVSNLHGQYQRADENDLREKIQARIGKLMGGSATLWIGGISETEIDARKTLAEATANAMRAAVKEGALPGGGLAYLHCRRHLTPRLEASANADERAAYRILYDALAEPARAIFENAGFEPGEILGRLEQQGDGQGFDVIKGRLSDKSNLLDGAAIQKMALKNAVLTAGMALTIDVLVHHKTPDISREPG
jgi:chaperonin GroEL